MNNIYAKIIYLVKSYKQTFPKHLSLLLLAWILVPSIPTQAGGKESYKKSTYINFEEALVEGKSRSPYSSYLFKKKEAMASDLSQWKPDWRNNIRMSKSRLK